MGEVKLYSNQVDEAITVMREVAAWGRGRGFRMWLDEWLTPEELLTADAQPENFCICKLDGKTCCAFILQWNDPVYWPGAARNEAAYIHKLCVKRDFSGQHIAKRAVETVKQICRERGVRHIRLDTALDEEVVKKIYFDIGFQIVDIIGHPSRRSVALYELEV